MGQRHQQFLIVPNPKKFSNKHSEIRKGLDKISGRKNTTVLPFFNGWLYGRSALTLALNVLDHVKHLNKEDQTKDISFDHEKVNRTTPFTVSGIDRIRTFSEYITKCECIINYTKEDITGATNVGFHDTFFDSEDFELYQNDITGGDNNDGITIIDTINKKYCFMNVHTYETDDEVMSSISDLPPLVPLTAREYVSVYYPENKESCNTYWLERFKEKPNLFRDNIVMNEKIAERFDEFELMTLDEVKNYFPESFKQENAEAIQ